MQSAPDVFSKIVFSASIANPNTLSLLIFSNNLVIDAAPATQHAEEEPNPTPEGISDSTRTLIPEWELFFSIILFAK